MERSVAVKKLRKLLGDRLGYRVNPKSPTREERAAAKEALPAAISERRTLSEKRTARERAILAADVEYQSLCAAYETARKNADHLMSISHTYKITVGVTTELFFHVKAEGDSWEEVIDKLQQRAVA